MRLTASIVLSSLFIVVNSVPVFASYEPVANAPANTTVAPSTNAPAAEAVVGQAPVVPVAVKVDPSDNGLVSLDFQDADIKNVLKVLAYKSGVNIVAGPDVTGLVTIQLTDVPWPKALDVILTTYGYGFDRKGNIITVTTIENLKKRRDDNQILQEQEPLVTKTFSLSFSKASDVVDSLSKIKSTRGSVNFDTRTNTLIVVDIQNNLDLMAEVVATLDSVTPQVLIEAKIIKTTVDDSDTLGIDWNAVVSAAASQHATNFPFTAQSNKFIPSGGTVSNNTFKYGTLDASTFSATLQMLSSRSNTKVLSNPRIVTLDNQPAKIVVGTQYPFAQYTYNTEQAKMQVSGWEYKDIGIIFEVTPHVNNARVITMDLHPRITNTDGNVEVEGTSVPKLTVEEAQTKVMIEDGQTLVIAGLISDDITKTTTKLPILGDIPLVGALFKQKVDTKTKTELLIFLTPHIITADSPSSAQPAQK